MIDAITPNIKVQLKKKKIQKSNTININLSEEVAVKKKSVKNLGSDCF